MQAIIEVNELKKQYSSAKELAVSDVSFTVREGGFFAFLGPNGAGKTTTISILTTTLSKTSGEVKIAGYDLERETKHIRDKVGIIFQQPSLDPQLSAEENIRLHACLYGMYSYRPALCWMPAAYRNRVMELAEILGLQDALSPAILFLDELTLGLDTLSRRSLWSYIDDVRKEFGTTVFLTTHYMDEAEHVDKICIINHGKIAMSCSPDETRPAKAGTYSGRDR